MQCFRPIDGSVLESDGCQAVPVSQGGNELTTRRRTITALLLATALLTNVSPAHAIPQSKRAKAAAVKAQIDRLDTRVEMAAERYNLASMKHDKLLRQKREASALFTRIKGRMGVVQGHLSTRANAMYRQGPMGFAAVLLGSESFEEFASTWDVLAQLNTNDAASVAELKDLRTKAKRARNEVSAKEEAAAQQVRVMASNKRSIERQLAERKSKLKGIEAEIKRLEDAEERARRARYSSYSGYDSSVDENANWNPSSSSLARKALASALTKQGSPYVWGASGPNSFDCSGLIVWAYRQYGRSLPHHSGSLIGCGKRVSRGNLEPGDLVFFGSPIHHVGIYVGGGRYLHAPHSGSVVQISSLWGRSGYTGACRIF